MAGRKRAAAINDLISSGLVSDGELLRYKNKQGQVLLIGRARVGGIEVKGTPGLLNFTAFEAAAGSKYHRPAEHTHATSGRTLQALQLGMAAAASGSGAAASEAAPAEGGRDAEGEPLSQESHDDSCYVCGLGGDLMCCETCAATMHAPCAGLAAVPEGDWHCPWCHCDACGRPGWAPAEAPAPPPALPHTGVAWVECGEGYCSLASLGYPPAPVGGPEAAAAPAEGQPATAGGAAAATSAAAKVGPAGAAAPGDVAVRMDIDGGAAASAAAQQALVADGDTTGPAPDQNAGPTDGGAENAPAQQQQQGQGQQEGQQQGAQAQAGSSADGHLDLSQLLAVLAAAAAAPPHPTWQPGSGEEPLARPGAAGEAWEARCPVSGRRRHGACLPGAVEQALQQAAQQGAAPAAPWFGSHPGQALSWLLAWVCSRGVVPLGALGDGTPLSFQLVRGAAVAQPQDCCGYAPQYSAAQREELRRALSAAAYVLKSCYLPLVDSRTGGDALLWMLRGACLGGRQLDFSGMHTALLYAGSTLVAAACVGFLGPHLAEVPLLATRPELQRNRLGSALLAAVEGLVAAASTHATAAAATGGGQEGGAAEGPLLLTPAYWGRGKPYVAYPPGQSGVPDVVPILQARWGYALATREQLLAAWRHPLLRLPGLLLACKRLGGGAGAVPQQQQQQLALPRRLVLNEAAGCNVGAMLREGTAVTAPSAAPQSGQVAAKEEAASDPMATWQQGGLLGLDLGISF